MSRVSPGAGWRTIGTGLLVLSLGTLVYVLDRPAASTPFFAPVNLSHLFSPVFGQIGGSLPAFSHAFAFSLLTAALMGRTRAAAVGACLGWLLVDSVFELGQHPAVSGNLARALPPGLELLPILGRAGDFFLAGTFDWNDLLSIALGAFVAYGVIRRTARGKPAHA